MACGVSERLVQHVLQETAPDGRQDLEAHLALCAECRGELEELRELREMGMRVRPRLSAEDWARFEESLAARLEQARHGRPLRRRSSASRRKYGADVWTAAITVAAAAALLVAAGLLVFTGGAKRPAGTAHPARTVEAAPAPPAAPAWRAQLASLSGGVRLVRGEHAADATAGEAVVPGDRIETGPGGRAVLQGQDGSRIELDGNTRIVLADRAGAKRLSLGRGALYARITAQPEGRPMVLNPGRTDEVTVLGTAFELSRQEEETLLRVEEGEVRFGADRAAVAVRALQASRVQAGAAPDPAASIPPAQVAPWRHGKVPAARRAPGLVGHWKFDEREGSTVFDASGFGNHGTIHGATREEGLSGRGLRFDWTSRVDMGSGRSLRVTEAVTIAAWVRILPQTNPDTEKQPFLSVGQQGNERNYRFSVCRTGTEPDEWRLRMSHGWEGGDATQRARSAYTEILVRRDAWMHVAFVVTTEDGGHYEAYVDGLPVRTYANLRTAKGKVIGKEFTRLTPVDAPVHIESVNDFRGIADEVRIYNRALSAEEVARLAEPPTP